MIYFFSGGLYLLTGAYAFFWIAGLGVYAVSGAPPPSLSWAASAFMWMAGMLAVIHAAHGRRAAVVAAGITGFLIEVLGVHTGFPFGSYQYTEAFRPHLFGVPVVLACAWGLLAAFARVAIEPTGARNGVVVVVGAALLTMADLLLDPVAVHAMGLWQWNDEGAYFGIPATNYAGWFLASVVVMSVFIGTESVVARVRRATKTGAPLKRDPFTLADTYGLQVMGVSLFIFFTVLAAIHAFWLPVIVGALLIAAACLLPRCWCLDLVQTMARAGFDARLERGNATGTTRLR